MALVLDLVEVPYGLILPVNASLCVSVKSSEDVLIAGYGEIHLVSMKAACTMVVHSFMLDDPSVVEIQRDGSVLIKRCEQ